MIILGVIASSFEDEKIMGIGLDIKLSLNFFVHTPTTFGQPAD